MRSSNLALTTGRARTKALAPWNLFSALLYMAEPQSTVLIKRVLAEYGIAVHTVSSVADADQITRGNRLDLVVCDLDVPGANQLACLQASTMWRGMAIGLIPGRSARHALNRRIHLRVAKPFTVDMLARGLRAAYTNMVQRRIATYRHTVPARVISGTLSHRGGQRTLHQVNVLNLSQTGLCLNAAEPLPYGASLTMSLVLPEISYAMHASGNVVWSHSTGRTGVAFDHGDCPEMKRLHQRLNDWLPRELGLMARLT
jgi:CheY-like chemotaxis protein